MRILFVYQYLTLGGVEAVLRARLDGLPARGIEAQAWFLSDGDGRRMFAELEDRIHVGSVEALGDFLRSQPQDLVSAIDTPEVFPVVGAVPGSRLVVEAHSPYLENLEYLRSLDPRRVAAVFVPSAYQRQVAQQRLGRGIDVRVVPNALRASFVREPEPFAPKPPRPIVGWIGRLDALKNWQGFLAVAGRIARVMPGVEFWMAGDSPAGEAAEDLFRLATRAGVGGRLFWFRGLPHDQARIWLDAVRESGGLVISTSRGESFGMAIAEAMARGCAVVAPALGPFPEIIRHGETGLLSRPGSAAAGAAAALRFLKGSDLRATCGARAREAILARHASQPAIAELAGALRTLISG